MAHNAKAGGEWGANGEFYKGGQFVADNPNTTKGVAAKKGQRRIEIEPYKWILAEADIFPIMKAAGIGTVARFKRTNGWRDYSEIELLANAEELCMRNHWDVEQIKSFIAQYNAGERIYRK